MAVSFFNNLEEVKKSVQRMVRAVAAACGVLMGCDCINHNVCKVISSKYEDRFGYGKRKLRSSIPFLDRAVTRGTEVNVIETSE